jgi:hypothetical protein
MTIVPQHIEDLLSAARRRDRAQLRAWLDIFSGPEEQYAAVRALADALGREKSGPAYALARWAAEQLEEWQGFVIDDRA